MSGKRICNPLTGDYIINSPAGRLDRPWKGELSTKDLKSATVNCDVPKDDPLAPGALRKNGERMPMFTGTYLFRNDFPVMNASDEEESLHAEATDDLFITDSCQGVSHVLVYSPDYKKHFLYMEPAELASVFKAWNEFFAANKAEFDYIQIFENKGSEVGSSLPHPHCQIWSTKFLPTTIAKILDNQTKYYQKHQRPMLIDYVQTELKKKERIVADLEHFVILVPYWAYWPYEVMILPKRNFQSINQMTSAESANFMQALSVMCRKYVGMFETSQIPYIMGLRNQPTGKYLDKSMDLWTFHVVVYPPLLSHGRKKFMAGYELLCEVQRDFDTTIAAQRLREIV